MRYENNFREGFHVSYYVEEIEGIEVKVNEAVTSESVYVNYYNPENGKKCICRFSTHTCNGEKFGDYLNGYTASRDEIMFRLGLKKRTFVPNIIERLVIDADFISKDERKKLNEERLNVTIKDLYAMGEGADLTEYVGKVTSDGKWRIKGDKVVKDVFEETGTDFLGQKVRIGKYIYE